MGTPEPIPSRPLTPESSLTNSLYNATNTIDDLTIALSNFSRIPSPDLPVALSCCCNFDECENLQAWHELKSRLESRLTLSAEVGQALLQRHEAYVRRHEAKCRIRRTDGFHRRTSILDDEDDDDDTMVFRQEQLDSQYSELLKEKLALEKRLNQALVNSEVTEVSNKTLLQELHDAQATISRLTAHQARSIGWDSRLTAALKERDDMQQERDSESHRARLAESRFAALKDKTIKLQTEVRRLQEALEEKRSHRLESSGNLLQDARTALESIRETGSADTMDGYEEITKILTSLVQDSEALKHDNAELQKLLSESREDFAVLQEEFEEYKANPPVLRSGANTPNSRHLHRASVTSIASRDYPVFSTERKPRRHLEPLILDSNRPTSPNDSLSPYDSKWTPPSKSSSRHSPSHYGFEIETLNDDQETISFTEKRRSHKPLLLLSRSRGVQTEPSAPSLLLPSPLPSLLPSLSPHDHSEASSFSESSSVQISSLIERVTSLLNRMLQTDPLTLANRLKRQHLQGADVGHLSKTTISNIVSEVNSLRQQYRSLLEEDKAALPVTRKDLRGLFKFLRDAFVELGQIRSTLNEVILDPSLAPKISDQALHPERGEKSISSENSANSAAQSWIAPISRLFSPPRNDMPPPTLTRNPRFVPKSGPALAASATTVNVEFSGVGGRSTTSAIAAPVIARSPPTEGTTALKDIFAGAPQLSASTSTATDTWVVIPQPVARRIPSIMQLGFGAVEHPLDDPFADGSQTVGKNTVLPVPKAEVTRAVDAVIDERSEAVDQGPQPLLRRTLRRRGLSDSSIRATFAADAPSSQGRKALAGVFKAAWPDSSLVFQALSKTVQNFKLGGSGSGTEPHLDAAPAHKDTPTETPPPKTRASEESVPEAGIQIQVPQVQRPRTPTRVLSSTPAQTGVITSSTSALLSPTSAATSPKSIKGRKAATIGPRKGGASDFTSWAAASFMLDPVAGVPTPVARNLVGSFREESFMQRSPRHGDEI